MAPEKVPFGISNPGSVSIIAGVATDTLAYSDLTTDELAIFDADLIKMSKYFSLNRDLQMLFLEDRDTYLWATSIAKKQLATGFGGVLAGSGEFGMQFIRPKTILGTNDWLQSYASAGWQNVFGNSTTLIDLSSTSTTYGNPQNRVMMVFPKFYSITTPKMREVWFHVGPTDYPIWPMEFISLADLYVAGLPASPLIVVNGKFYMRGNVGSAIGVVDGLAPLGLTLAKAEYMTGSGQE